MKKVNIPEEMIVKPGEEDFYVRSGYKLRSARSKLGLSAEEIAKHIGITTDLLDKYEKGILAIPVYHFIPILQFMGFPEELENLK